MSYIDAIRMQLESIREELDTVAEMMIDARLPIKELGKVVQSHDLLEDVEKALAPKPDIYAVIMNRMKSKF